MNGISQIEFEKYYTDNPNLIWDYEVLSSCNYISWKIIRNNLHKPWNLNILSKSTIITFEMIQDTPFLRWNLDAISENSNMTFDVIYDNIYHTWNFDILRNRFTEIEYNKLVECKQNYIDNESEYDSSDDDDYNNIPSLYTV